MEAVKMFFFLVGVLLTFTKCTESRKPVESVADLDNMAIQTVFSQSVGSISDQCLQCICMAESNCRKIGYMWYRGTLSCGYYMIDEIYWQECGRPGGDFMHCALDYSCARTCVKKYTTQLGEHSGCPDTCQTYARTHHGGPLGCHNKETIPFWHRVQSFGCN
uniref:lysozyme n=1 Tax=Cristaria plicata TaxID=165446 RepID=I6ZIX7_CRIPL|nr:lysozyme 2 [Cristaria plicata]